MIGTLGTNWTGTTEVESTRTRVINNGPDVIRQGETWRPGLCFN